MPDLLPDEANRNREESDDKETEIDRVINEIGTTTDPEKQKDLEQVLSRLEEIREQNITEAFRSVEKAYKIPDGSLMKAIESGRPFGEELKKIAPDLFDAIKSKTDKIDGKLIPDLENALGRNVKAGDLLFEVDNNGQPKTPKDAEIKAKCDEVQKGWFERWGRDVFKGLGFLIKLGIFVGAGWLLYNTMCNAAQSESGCYAVNPNTGDQEKVNVYNLPPGINCDFEHMCGSCLKSQPNFEAESQCCNPNTDPAANKHKGWNYTLSCSSPGKLTLDAFHDIDNLIKNMFSGGWLKWVLVAIAIPFILLIVYYLMKWIFNKIKHKLDSDKESHTESE